MCFMSTGGSNATLAFQRPTPAQTTSFIRTGSAMESFQKAGEQLVADRGGATGARKKAAAKTSSSSSPSTILTQPDFGFAKKTLLGT